MNNIADEEERALDWYHPSINTLDQLKTEQPYYYEKLIHACQSLVLGDKTIKYSVLFIIIQLLNLMYR